MLEDNKHRDEFAKFKRIWFVITILGVFLYYHSHIGLFTIQPNSTLTEGVTAVVWREAGTPFFNSPDAMCLKIMGNVSSVCRTVAMWKGLVDRIIFRLPYSRWAYLRSTGGLDYEQFGEFLIP
jgi:hypothetical protein